MPFLRKTSGTDCAANDRKRKRGHGASIGRNLYTRGRAVSRARQGDEVDRPLDVTPMAENLSDAGAVTAARTEAGEHASARGALFRKYLLLFIGLVSAALLVNAVVELTFAYRDSRALLAQLQLEKVDIAKERIEQFIGDIRRQLEWTTTAQFAAQTADERRLQFLLLLRQVPAITGLSQLDADGREQLKVSRIALDAVGSEADFSHDPAFTEALAHKAWFSPVYFRQGSEPYLTLALAGPGRRPGVTVAEINLKLIWDVIIALRIGQSGYAYVVDRQGKLIAHPDMSLVLRDTIFSGLSQVAAGLRALDVGNAAVAVPDVDRNFAGSFVLSAHASLPALGWLVFVELPMAEALRPLYASALHTVLVLAAGLLLAALAAWFVVRRVTGPIALLEAGAARIGAGDLDARIAVRTGDELETLANQFNSMAAQLQQSYAGLERKVEERTRDLSESLEQQTATAEVLQVINSSPGDPEYVFTAILEKAHQVCDAAVGTLAVFDNGYFQALATHGYPKQFVSQVHHPVRPYAPQQALLRGDRLYHVPDATAVEWGRADQLLRTFIDLTGVRTYLLVPLLKEGHVVGFIGAHRLEVRPFSEREIALLESFATQAVIAMENARLITETRERAADLQQSLEYQTATSDVLSVISRSTADVQPVLDTLVVTAARLCNADMALIYRREGDVYRLAANQGFPIAYEEFARQLSLSPGRASVTQRAALECRVSHVADITADPEYDLPEASRVGGARTALGVPLLREGEPVGVFTLARQCVEPFTERQIELVRTFADQAVIAIENARLLTEQREALERQTATAEVLATINENPGDLAPVFDTILEKALTLSEAAFGTLWTFDTESAAGRIAATRNIPSALAEFRATHPPSGPSPLLASVLRERRTIHQLDIREDESYRAGHAAPRSVVELGGARTLLLVPLLKDQTVLGTFQIYRQDVRAFTDRQISLVESFAAQAVIAMENARLLTEQREALERQTAMAEVLRVINTNPGNLRPVFDIILAKAHAVCGADLGGLFLWNDTHSWLEASLNYPEPLKELLSRPRPLEAGFFIKRLTEEPYVHIPDCQVIAADINRTFGPGIADSTPRTVLAVALRGDGVTIGHITANRLQMRPYTAAEISLLESFAAQAVIAMDNARLLNEIRQRQSELDITFENMGDGVAMFDAEQKLAAWNRNFQDILDLPDDAVRVGLPFADYIRGLAERGEYGTDANTDEQITRLTALLDQANRFERIRPNGRVIDIRQNPIPDGGFVIIYADITERKRAEEALRVARDEAETALRELKLAQANLVQAEKMASLGQLTAGIAHEIKNPLNFVNNFSDLSIDLLEELNDAVALRQQPEIDELSATLKGNLQKIAEHGRRADGIVRSMLEHSRGATGERRSIELNTLVEEAFNLAYHGARAQDQNFNITLERDFADGIAPIEVNPQDLTRVFLNLFSNGFYATRKRQVSEGNGFEPTLRVSTRDSGRSVEIRVRDNGTGVPADVRDKLFQPFFTTKPTGEGTGLGLSISYDIVVKQHGGELTVDSEPNAFTEFVIALPRGSAADQGSRA
jgi:GAF domain-containing protein/nitrogen-specific signal transduction histidine kinase/HAMP domain-containing protein